MSDTAYAAFIEDCRRERATLIGLIEAVENKMLAPGSPIEVPENMAATTQTALLSMQRTVSDLSTLIGQYETG